MYTWSLSRPIQVKKDSFICMSAWPPTLSQSAVVGRSALGLVEVTCVSDVSYSMLDLSTSRDNLGLVNDGDNFGAVNGRDNLGVVNGAAIWRATNWESSLRKYMRPGPDLDKMNWNAVRKVYKLQVLEALFESLKCLKNLKFRNSLVVRWTSWIKQIYLA